CGSSLWFPDSILQCVLSALGVATRYRSKIELRADFRDPRSGDRSREQVARAEDLQVIVGRAGIEGIEDVKRDSRSCPTEPQEFCKPQVDLIESVSVLRAGLYEIHSGDSGTARQIPAEALPD